MGPVKYSVQYCQIYSGLVFADLVVIQDAAFDCTWMELCQPFPRTIFFLKRDNKD